MLLFENAKKYNIPNSQIYRDALQLQVIFGYNINLSIIILENLFK